MLTCHDDIRDKTDRQPAKALILNEQRKSRMAPEEVERS